MMGGAWDRETDPWLEGLRAILRWLALPLPDAMGAEWLETWESELWYVWRDEDDGSRFGRRLAAARFVSGAVPDVFGCARWPDVARGIGRGIATAWTPASGPATVCCLVLFVSLATAAAGVGMAAPLLLHDPPGLSTGADLVRVGRLKDDGSFDNVSHPAFLALLEESRSFDGLAAYARIGTTVASERGSDVRPVTVQLVTDEYFRTLGLRLRALPRGSAAPAEEDGLPWAIVSHRLWNARFPGVSSSREPRIEFGGVVVRVAGIAPEGFVGTDLARPATDAWLPIELHEVLHPGRDVRPGLTSDGRNWLWLVGRLRPGLTAEVAAREVDGVLASRVPPPGSARTEAVWAVIPLRGLFPDENGQGWTLILLLLGGCVASLAVAFGLHFRPHVRAPRVHRGMAPRVMTAVPAVVIGSDLALRALSVFLPFSLALSPGGTWFGWFVAALFGGTAALLFPAANRRANG